MYGSTNKILTLNWLCLTLKCNLYSYHRGIFTDLTNLYFCVLSHYQKASYSFLHFFLNELYSICNFSFRFWHPIFLSYSTEVPSNFIISTTHGPLLPWEVKRWQRDTTFFKKVPLFPLMFRNDYRDYDRCKI